MDSRRNGAVTFIAALAIVCGTVGGAEPAAGKGRNAPGNKPERVEWFQDLSLGMFIHWSVDCQLGVVISHSLVGASDEYCQRYFDELPGTFNPKRFDPAEVAALAKVAGMKYVVFTTKHHSGFCMWDTKTSDFSVTRTPYGKDVTAELVEALRAQGIAVGFYFSPDDFHFLWKHGKPISREVKDRVLPLEYPALMEHDKAQLKELLTNYGPIDILFIDGPVVGRQDEGLKEFCWKIQPNLVITRGAMDTPEQELPGKPLKGPWEACFTLGRAWQYQPTNEDYKSGTQLIHMLVETRAKGGNLLLNVGPRPDGALREEEEARVREMALWNFVNREAVFDTRPWHVTNEGRVWFTRGKGEKDADTVYAIVLGDPVTGEVWQYGTRKTVALKSVRATDKTEVQVLGQNGERVEYRPFIDARTTWTQDETALHVSAVNAQRLADDRKWPNPVVLKITHARAAP